MKLKKFLATGVAAVMVLAMTACGDGKKDEKVSLDGTWVSETVKMNDGFAKSFDENFSSSDISIAEYLPDVSQTMTITLEKDGNYTMDLDIDVDIEAFRSNFKDYLNDVFTDMNDGVPMTDEDYQETFGSDLDSIVAEFTSDEEMEFLFGSETYVGDYTEKDGTLILDEGSDAEITGTFDGKTIVFDLESLDMGTVTFTKK